MCPTDQKSLPTDWLQVLFRIFDDPYFENSIRKKRLLPEFCHYFLQATPLRYFVRARMSLATCFLIITHHSLLMMDRDSSVGIGTCYWLNGLRFESRWGRLFPHPSRLALRHTKPPVQRVQDPVVERPRRGVGHPLHLA